MKFGTVQTIDAEGHTLAHSQIYEGFRFAKGTVLTNTDINNLQSLGVTEIVVAQLFDTDVDENTAAANLAFMLANRHIHRTEPFSGRVNLVAQANGILRVNADNVAAFNSVNEAITMATLPDYAQVHEGMLLATIKIIPYAADTDNVTGALQTISMNTLEIHPFKLKTVGLLLTKTPNFKNSLLIKGEEAIRKRTKSLGLDLHTVEVVAHTIEAVTKALEKNTADLTLILGASATSDREDVAPAALIAAGGTLTRFGMPVDPGNLLFLGKLDEKPVVGLPGCVRSPALNGADWILERLSAGLDVADGDIALLGVGGLLKEVSARPQPRRSVASRGGKPRVLLLAAGRSTRMRGENKLLRLIDGEPLVVRTAKRLSQSKTDGMTIVVNPDTTGLVEILAGQGDQIIEAADANCGLAASLRAGINALPATTPAVIVALADMPDVTSGDIDALIDAYDPASNALIVAPVAPNGKRGNPVLFDRRYFELLASLKGDKGAKTVVDSETTVLRLVQRSDAVLIDLDTPEAWDIWEQTR